MHVVRFDNHNFAGARRMILEALFDSDEIAFSSFWDRLTPISPSLLVIFGIVGVGSLCLGPS